MRRAALLFVQAALLAACMLAPTVWLAYVMEGAQFKRAAADRAAWCAAHPDQEAGPEQCYLVREGAQSWCEHDWQELAPQYCQIDNTARPGAGSIN